MSRKVYADNAATTAVAPQVLEAMLPFYKEAYGNPSSLYSLGQEAKKPLEEAREAVARCLGAQPREIYFTSCGTESDNWAIKGAAHAMKKRGKSHIITSAFEHHAVLHTCQALEKEGFTVTYLPVHENGIVRPQELEAAITEETGLVTIMYANNEIGTLQPIPEIGAICKKHGVLFHTDAVQAVGNVPIDVKEQNIDMLSLSGHKLHAPKGVGALYIRSGVSIQNYMDGGAQERGKRGGTENVASMEGESLLLMLDLKGISASSGSACTSGSLDPSHVLLALGLPHEVAHGSLRLSFGDYNSMEDIDYILEVLPPIIERLRSMSPLWDAIQQGKVNYDPYM